MQLRTVREFLSWEAVAGPMPIMESPQDSRGTRPQITWEGRGRTDEFQ